MKRDLRDDPIYGEVRDYAAQVYSPGTAQTVRATDLSVTADGTKAALTGWRFDRLEGKGRPQVALIDPANGKTTYLASPRGDDRLPRWSPDGGHLAWLSTRGGSRLFELFVAAADGLQTPSQVSGLDGVIESVAWAADSRRLLMTTAGFAADLAGYQGATGISRAGDANASWLPIVETPDETDRWRRLWLCELGTSRAVAVGPGRLNIWDVAWAGPSAAVAVVSDGPGEADWYSAHLSLIDLSGGTARPLYRSSRQLGMPTASPSGAQVALIESVSSDRGLTAGDILVIDVARGKTARLDIGGIAVTALAWRSEGKLAFAGLRDFEMVVGEIDVASGERSERWASEELTSGDPYPGLTVFGASGIALLVDGYRTPPTLLMIDEAGTREVVSFASSAKEALLERCGRIAPVRWQAPDGLEIQGWVITPEEGKGPFPLVMMIHGGPVFCHRGRWLSHPYYGDIQFLVRKGYALFLPNPRGSSGRGNDFAAQVLGDMGGAETGDLLSGIDALVSQGIADPARLGVMGASHGGFMTSWLVTQDHRFAAAITIAPVVNWYSQHWTSNIPTFDQLFLADDPRQPAGRYFQRSPIMHAHKARTPTMVVAGVLDRCTPPGQAVEFYNALGDSKAERALLLYPEEGHRVQHLPARIDYIARVHEWFEKWMPAVPGSQARGGP